LERKHSFSKIGPSAILLVVCGIAFTAIGITSLLIDSMLKEWAYVIIVIGTLVTGYGVWLYARFITRWTKMKELLS